MKASTIRRELLVLLTVLVVAFIANIYAIVAYNGQWSELISQLHFVVMLAVFLYFVLGVIRIVIYGVQRLIYRDQ